MTTVTRPGGASSETSGSSRHRRLPPILPMADAQQDPRLAATWKALEMVIDPEVGLDIVTMGLVYDVALTDDVALVTHTLTTPGCPMEAVITQGIRDAVSFVSGVRGVETRLVWEPAWHAGMIDRGALG